MKQYLLMLCVMGTLHAAEPTHSSPLMELYCKSNRDQENFFLASLEECFDNKKININFDNKSVVSIGCDTGGIEHYLVKTKSVQSIHAIGANAKMINFCKKEYRGLSKLSFLHCCPEDFGTRNVYDLALAPWCINTCQDKEKVFNTIYGGLKKGGHFFAHIETSSNAESFINKAYHDIIANIPFIGNLLQKIQNPTGNTRPDYGELHVMLSRAGFDVKKTEYKSYDCEMSADEWRKTLLPLFLNTPEAQYLINTISDNWILQQSSAVAFGWIPMSPEEKEQHNAPFFPEIKDELVKKIGENDFLRCVFHKFFMFCLNHMQKNKNGTYTWTHETTVVLAQKK